MIMNPLTDKPFKCSGNRVVATIILCHSETALKKKVIAKWNPFSVIQRVQDSQLVSL